MGQAGMTSADRVFNSLLHREPDRVPFDLGSSIITGINIHACRAFLDHLGMAVTEIPLLYERSEIAEVDEELLKRLEVDTRGLFPNVLKPQDWPVRREEDTEYLYIADEMGLRWRKPKEDGHFYDVCSSPLAGEISREAIDRYPWPDMSERRRVVGLRDRARSITEDSGAALVLESPLVETLNTPLMLRGYENFYVDLASDPASAGYLMDRMVELQSAFWKVALEELSEFDLIVRIGDDLGDQQSLLISPDMYRTLIKPRHRRLIESIRELASQRVFVFFHSDGAVAELIPDLIEIGVDILNPVQYTAAGMETRSLKKEFGQDLTFWGGGVDTQDILPNGTPERVREEVKRRIEDLAPGGGFVFGAVHNIQYDVPACNILAMWEALHEYGKY
jgi:uroporphyrinogen decarboxylase